MNKEAIEIIKGYYCEVTEAQWGELVRVAAEACAKVYRPMWPTGREKMYVSVHDDGIIVKEPYNSKGDPIISFPDFLSKLKGDEKWEPKSGEMVEVSHDGKSWHKREFVACRSGQHVCWFEEQNSPDTAYWKHCRPNRPTITRAEAESLLNKRIID
jgi:hypothetical protein